MKSKFTLFLLFIFLIFFTPSVMAHCPLCTVGAGAAAAGAVWLGVSKVVVALFIGAFAMSMGMWFSGLPKKQYFPFQKTSVVLIVFLSTVIPLIPLFTAVGPLYLSFVGTYGTTYAVNYSIASSLFGGLIVFISPNLSKRITNYREGKIMPFQGTLLTLSLLSIIGLTIQILL